MTECAVSSLELSGTVEGILGEHDGELLKQFTFCALHIQMRIVEWIGNRTLADAKGTFKESKRKQVSDAIKEWNRKMQQELHQKSGMTIFETLEGIPKCSVDGTRATYIVNDLKKLADCDLTQPGLRDGSLKYPSTFVQGLADLQGALGHAEWVRHTLPDLARALSDVSIALDLAMMTKLFKDGPAIFERHIRRGILSLYELYNGKGSYYMWQLVGSIVDQFRRFEVLGLYTQGTMEQCQQLVADGTKHSNNGAKVGRMTNAARADPALKPAVLASRAPPPPCESLFRRLLFRSMAYTKSLRQRDPEMSYGTAIALQQRLLQAGRTVEHPIFEREILICGAFLKYYGRWRRLAKCGAKGSREKYCFKCDRHTLFKSTRAVYGPVLALFKASFIKPNACPNGQPGDDSPAAAEAAAIVVTVVEADADRDAEAAVAFAEAFTEAAADADAEEADISEATHELAAVAWFELTGTVAFLTEVLKLPAGKGRGQWGASIFKICSVELEKRHVERFDLLVRTHIRAQDQTLKPFASTKESLKLYDKCCFKDVSGEGSGFPFVNGCVPFEGEQQYRSASLDDLILQLEPESLPDDVRYLVSTTCHRDGHRLQTWFERDAIAAMRAHHTDPKTGDGADVESDLMPLRNRRKMCIYFFVPRRAMPMDTSA